MLMGWRGEMISIEVAIISPDVCMIFSVHYLYSFTIFFGGGCLSDVMGETTVKASIEEDIEAELISRRENK